jgi:hypothetical protein
VRKLLLLGVLIFSAALASQAQHQPSPKFDASAAFQPSTTTMQQARIECAKLSQPQFGDCFVEHMQAAGASPQAVSFMHAIHNDGFMRDFRGAGRVSIASVFYPFRSNENQGVLLVNGSPDLFDPDDSNLIPQDELAKNSTYAKLLKQHPKMMVFPGDRAGTKFIEAKSISHGGQRFELPYQILDGCHACALVATLRLAFDFDDAGKFIGAKVLSIKPERLPGLPLTRSD